MIDLNLVEQAKHRYMIDPAFRQCMETVVARQQLDHGIEFDAHDLSLATEAAACALTINETNWARTA